MNWPVRGLLAQRMPVPPFIPFLLGVFNRYFALRSHLFVLETVQFLNTIPVLMVSTESEEESVKRAIAAGATGYIPKPFSPEELATAIKATLEAR